MTENGPVMKCKIVFLGDQSVGKTSIINRFIFDNFTGNEQVNRVTFSQPSESTSFPKPSMSRIRPWGCSCGTLPVSSASIRSYQAILRTRTLPSSYTTSPVPSESKEDENSYGNINKWVEDVKEVRGEEAMIFILGNKIDLESER